MFSFFGQSKKHEVAPIREPKSPQKAGGKKKVFSVRVTEDEEKVLRVLLAAMRDGRLEIDRLDDL